MPPTSSPPEDIAGPLDVTLLESHEAPEAIVVSEVTVVPEVVVSRAPSDPYTQQVGISEASERTAIDLDQAGRSAEAQSHYRDCEQALHRAAVAAMPDHIRDQPRLERHRREVLARLAHLQGLGGAPSTVPVEQHIQPLQLDIQLDTTCAAEDNVHKPAALYTCTAFGVVAGLAVSGPLVAVGGGAAAAFAATRKGRMGELSREYSMRVYEQGATIFETSQQYTVPRAVSSVVGAVAGAGLCGAKELDRRLELRTNAEAAVSAGLAKAREVDSRYELSSNARSLDDRFEVSQTVAGGLNTGLAIVQDANEKYEVTTTVFSGVAAGFNLASAAVCRCGPLRVAAAAAFDSEDDAPNNGIELTERGQSIAVDGGRELSEMAPATSTDLLMPHFQGHGDPEPIDGDASQEVPCAPAEPAVPSPQRLLGLVSSASVAPEVVPKTELECGGALL